MKREMRTSGVLNMSHVVVQGQESDSSERLCLRATPSAPHENKKRGKGKKENPKTRDGAKPQPSRSHNPHLENHPLLSLATPSSAPDTLPSPGGRGSHQAVFWSEDGKRSKTRCARKKHDQTFTP